FPALSSVTSLSPSASVLLPSLLLLFFSLSDTAITELCTLSLHDALPIFIAASATDLPRSQQPQHEVELNNEHLPPLTIAYATERSEEHTSELQSRFDLVCRLLLEKKNKSNTML